MSVSGPAAAGEPEWAYAAALAGLPYMAWDRLSDLLATGPPSEAWAGVASGGRGQALARAAARTSVAWVAEAHTGAGVAVHLLGQQGFPTALAGDHEAPPALFRLGLPAALDGVLVGIVGTRRATGYGRDVARQFGRELAEAGVGVVSGLALGIDGAAHEGALAGGGAPPVGVVGSGLDVVYPRRHADLWRRVAADGCLLSEAPLGARPEPWRFPARNRLIAALSSVLVVVESHAAGGSMHTVRAAAERGVTVMAVPGPVRSPASMGTNRLLADGCVPACDPGDVLVALALETAGRPARVERRPPPAGEEAAVLELLGWEAVSVDALLAATDLAPSRVAVALSRLEQSGWARGRGGWWERVGAP
ncbi:MAG TPA: DNA-processing protein DprA [Acidimicrobiales bacterium]|nr:DNA-processing protein DprA [Acidimicrobiales bacterium]